MYQKTIWERQTVDTLFQPANDDHALVETVFELTLEQPLAKTVEENFEKSKALAERLPGVMRSQSFTIEFGPMGGQQRRNEPEWAQIRRSRFRDDGQIVRSAGLNQNTIHVNILDYNRWDAVWPDVENTLIEILDAGVIAPENRVMKLGLQLINLFVIDDDTAQPDCTQLFTTNGTYIPSAAVESGFAFWQKTTFRSPISLDARRVADTTIDLVPGFDENRGRQGIRLHMTHNVSVDHDIGVAEYLKEGAPLDFDILRKRNHVMLCNMLTEEMCNRIGVPHVENGEQA